MSLLDKAILAFEDETLDVTMGERLAGLREALMMDAYKAFKSVGKPKSGFDEIAHAERMKLFKDMEKMYLSELNMNKKLGKSSDKMDKDFLNKIKQEKSYIGNIVRDIQPIKKEDAA